MAGQRRFHFGSGQGFLRQPPSNTGVVDESLGENQARLSCLGRCTDRVALYITFCADIPEGMEAVYICVLSPRRHHYRRRHRRLHPSCFTCCACSCDCRIGAVLRVIVVVVVLVVIVDVVVAIVVVVAAAGVVAIVAVASSHSVQTRRFSFSNLVFFFF